METINPKQPSQSNFSTSPDFQIKSFTESEKAKRIKIIILAVMTAILLFIFIGFLLNYSEKNSAGSVKSPVAKESSASIKEAKTVPNPITGELYNEEAIPPWISNRPLGVMINNHPDARPQTNLIQADIVYEMVAEGGITRFLSFYLTNTPDKIGPVRSIREYYLVLVKELGDAMIMHIGYSPQAQIDIDEWPVRSLFRGGATFWRENPDNVATEHTAYVNGVDLRTLGDNLGWEGTHTLTSWKFSDIKNKYAFAKDATNISVDFWSKGDFSAIWKYDSATGKYMRFMGYDSSDQPIPHIDRLTKQQLSASNVIVQFAVESSIPNDPKHRLDYQLLGSGKAVVFVSGKAVDATWSKTARDERTKFFDSNGSEIEFNRGKFWIEIVPDRNIDQVVYN